MRAHLSKSVYGEPTDADEARSIYRTERKRRPATTGRVKWFDDARGYGFITRDDGEGDLFVHFSAINSSDAHKTLAAGQRVTFEVAVGERGPRAIAVSEVVE